MILPVKLSSRAWENIVKFIAKSLALIVFYSFLWPNPIYCPPVYARTDLTANYIDLNFTINYVKTQVRSLFVLSNADSIGAFLLDDNLRTAYPITFIGQDRLEIIDVAAYQIKDPVQRKVYLKAFDDGCVTVNIDSWPNSQWANQMANRGVETGIICSLKASNRPQKKIRGILVFEYKGSTPPVEMSSFISSIEIYRDRIALASLNDYVDDKSRFNKIEDNYKSSLDDLLGEENKNAN